MPIPFTCPHCGKAMTVDDKFAGQTGPCAACKQTITIPSSNGASGGAGIGAIGIMIGVGIVCVLGCLVVGGVLAALMVPLQVGGAAANSASHNNLKQIMLAMHNYHDNYKTFPPAVVNDADGKPLYSWRVLLLPFLEQDHLYRQFDKDKAWDDPANLEISRQMLSIFHSPHDPELAPEGTNYFVVIGENTAFPADKPVGLNTILDGTSNTIGVVELRGIEGSWAAPIDPKMENIAMSIGPGPGQLNSPTPQGLNAAFCDGFVRTLPSNLPPGTLQLLFLRNDGMPVQLPP